MKDREGYRAKDKVTMEIMHLSHLIRQYMDSLGEYTQIPMPENGKGISGTNIFIMGYLYQNQQKDIFQKDLEEQRRVSSATISKVLRIMEGKGLIIREQVDYDKRLKKIVLSEKAKSGIASFLTNKKQLESVTTKGFTDEELEQFSYLLKKAQKNFIK